LWESAIRYGRTARFALPFNSPSRLGFEQSVQFVRRLNHAARRQSGTTRLENQHVSRITWPMFCGPAARSGINQIVQILSRVILSKREQVAEWIRQLMGSSPLHALFGAPLFLHILSGVSIPSKLSARTSRDSTSALSPSKNPRLCSSFSDNM
jgi:hypothetical protein